MPGFNAYTGYALRINGTPNVDLDSVNGLSVDPGTQEIINYAAGVQSPSFVGTMSASPMISFTTTDLETALPVIGLDGLSFPQAAPAVYTNVDAFFTKIGIATARIANATAEHFRIRCAEGLIIPKTLSWQQGSEATLSVEIHPIFDGTNNPVAYADLVALPFTPIIAEKFTGGKVIINGVAVDGVQGVSIDFGIDIEKLMAAGTVFPTRVHILRANPSISIKTKVVTNLSTFGLTGVAQGATPTDIYFQEIVSGGGGLARGAALTAVRIRVNASQGMFWSGPATGGNNDSFEGEIKCKPVIGSAAVLSIAVNQTQP